MVVDYRRQTSRGDPDEDKVIGKWDGIREDMVWELRSRFVRPKVWVIREFKRFRFYSLARSVEYAIRRRRSHRRALQNWSRATTAKVFVFSKSARPSSRTIRPLFELLLFPTVMLLNRRKDARLIGKRVTMYAD